MYRNCNNKNNITPVENLYKNMYINQNYKKKLELKNKIKYNKIYDISEIIPYLNQVIDSSDPDTDFSQIYHGYQTAESIRKNFMENDIELKHIQIKSLFNDEHWENIPNKYKKIYNQTIKELYKDINDWSWFPLIGLIHDLGKVLVLKDFYNLEEHFSVGDIYPLGCIFSKENIYYEKKYHEYSEDFNNLNYKSKLGIYKENCGFKNLEMTFSHDYYLSNVFRKSEHNIPDIALYIIQFHSFYVWHTPKNNIIDYDYFASDYDWYLLPLLKLFQKSDLYSKNNDLPNIDHIKKYYNDLILKYIPNKLNF